MTHPSRKNFQPSGVNSSNYNRFVNDIICSQNLPREEIERFLDVALNNYGLQNKKHSISDSKLREIWDRDCANAVSEFYFRLAA